LSLKEAFANYTVSLSDFRSLASLTILAEAMSLEAKARIDLITE